MLIGSDSYQGEELVHATPNRQIAGAEIMMKKWSDSGGDMSGIVKDEDVQSDSDRDDVEMIKV